MSATEQEFEEKHPPAVLAEAETDVASWACQMGERPPQFGVERVFYAPRCQSCMTVHQVHEALYQQAMTRAYAYNGVDVQPASVEEFWNDAV